MDINVLEVVGTAALHDAELDLVAMDRSLGRLHLGFRGAYDAYFDVFFEGIVTYRINNLQYQNVVSQYLLASRDSTFNGDLEAVARWTSSGAEDRLLITEEALAAHLAKIRSGDLVLFYVEPSWGAEAGVIAESIRIARKATP